MSNLVNPYWHVTEETWITTAGNLSGGVYHPSGKGDKTDGWNTTGIGIVGGGNRPELDVWNGTTWANAGHNIDITVTGASGVGTSSSITVAGGDYQSDDSGAACSNYDGTSWTQKANMNRDGSDTGKSRSSAIGTPSNFLSCGGEYSTSPYARTADVEKFDLSADSWSEGVVMPLDATTDGIMGCAGDGDSTSNGMVAGGWSRDYTITNSAFTFNGTSWSAVTDLDWSVTACIGGGIPTSFWVMGGQLSGGWGTGLGAVAYWNGTSWETKTNCLLEEAGAGGANNGGTNPQIGGGNIVGGSGNGSWTSGQYWG